MKSETIMGLEPRYLRERKARDELENESPNILQQTEPDPEDYGCSVDGYTALLRQCVLDNLEEPSRRFPTARMLPVILGLACVLWLVIGEGAVAVAHAFSLM